MPRKPKYRYLERRGQLFYWRRRWPLVAPAGCPKFFFRKKFLLFPLRTDVPRDAEAMARRLTDLTDLAFAACAEKTMSISNAEMEMLLVSLCRFQIEAADLAREVAPARSLEAAEYEQACAEAALGTLRQAILLRDREIANAPLRMTADRLGVALDEADPDYARLAMRALEAMIEAGEENMRRDRGTPGGTKRYLSAAQAAMDARVAVTQAPAAALTVQPAVDTAAGLAALGLAPTAATVPSGPTAPTTSVPQVTCRPVTAQVAASAPDVPHAAPVTPVPVPPSTAPAPQKEPRQQKPADRKVKAAEAPLRKIAEDYIALRCQGYRTFKRTETPSEKDGKSWEKNSSANVKSTLRLLEKGLPVSDLALVTEEMLTEFWTLVTRLPRSYADKPSEKRSLRQIVAETDAHDDRNEALTRARLEKQGASPGKIEFQILIEKTPRMRVATIYRHMQDAQRICRFAVAKGHLAQNIMEDHIWDKREYDQRELHQEDNKRDAWFDDLPALLRSRVFQQPLDEPGDPMFWAPLISVHSGLRSEEILQLATGDIRDVDGIPCFVLQQGVGQSLKSSAGRRTVPVHKNLIELGLLELVALRKRDGEPRLFPWLERSKAKKTFTETFSKNFTKYRKSAKVYRPGLDFHAFRTTFNQALVATGCRDSERRNLLGHAENDVGIKHYTPDGFATSSLRDCVNAVTYDISMVRRPFQEKVTAGVSDLAAHRRCRQSC
ncbi:tyrosine-type recombinase/integrase [Primorskyibacter sp. 2E233]|uniref:tyrosine-type recombinase/integrase n=1 Tax=Primorskyibacter sp. 2E233 TaxID=3413431 RepID=UPI003BEFAEB8